MASGGNTGNNVGSVQGHAFQTHNHAVTDPGHSHTMTNYAGASYGASYISGNGPTAGSAVSTSSNVTNITINNASAGGSTSQATTNETRPVNAYVNYIIKY